MKANSGDSHQPAHVWVKDITERDDVKGCYLVKKKSLGTTRRGEPFISITLADRTGEMEAKVWEGAEELSSLFQQGDVLEVKGYAGSYQGRVQISVSGLKASSAEIDPSIFLESSPRDISEMMRSLKEILREVKDIHLRTLIERLFGDREFVSRFKNAPAAKNFHHSYLGGLLEHTLAVCQMARQVADYYPQLNRDLLLTAAFLHDIGKTRELTFHLQIDYTDEGRLLGHVVLGAAMVEEKLAGLKKFPQDLAVRLKHMILGHHGHYEFGSPKRPKFLEAFALYLIDDLDAKINGLGRFMERDQREGAWTDFNRLFDRYFLKGKVLPFEKESDDRSTVDERQGTLFSP